MLAHHAPVDVHSEPSDRELFDSHPQPMWVYDLETLGILAVNDSALVHYGYSRSEFLNLTIKDIRPAEDVPALLANTANVSEGLDRAGVWRHLKKDGSVILVEITSHTMEFAGRRAELVMATDVTGHHEAEDNLLKAQHLLRLAGRIGRIGGWLADLTTRRVECSDEVCELLDLPHGTTMSTEAAPRSDVPGWQKVLREAFDKCAEDGAPCDMESEIITAAGRRIWIRAIGEPVYDLDGRMTHVQGALQDITEATLSQQWNDRKFRELADIVPQTIWTATPDGRVDYASAVFYNYLGKTPGELRPQEWPRVVHPDDIGSLHDSWQRSLKEGRHFSAECRVLNRHGEHRWQLTTANPVRDENGNVVKWYGSATDIHDRRLAEDAQRESEERFRQLAENIVEVFWMTTPEKDVMLYVSPGYEAIWGRSCDSLYQNPGEWVAAIHEDDRARVLEAAQRQAVERYVEEYRIVRPDGEVRWIVDQGFPVHNEAGEIYRIAGVARDITKRKIAELAREASEQRYQKLVSSIDGIVWEADAETFRFNFVSEQAQRLLGYPVERWTSDPDFWRNAIHPDDVAWALDYCSRAARERRDHEFEYRMLAADGRVVWLRDIVTMVTEDGKSLMRGIMIDITEQKRAELELSERMKELHCLYKVLELTTDVARPISAVCEAVANALPAGFQFPANTAARIALDGEEYRSAGWDAPTISLNEPIVVAGGRIGTVEVGFPEIQPVTGTGRNVFLDQERELLAGVALHIGRMLEARRMREQLAQSDRMQAVGQLTGGVAHDFNNLLTVILGNSEILAERLRHRPDLVTLAEMTLNAAERGADLVDRLVAFARRQALVPEPIAIDHLVAEMAPMLRRAVGAHIELTFQADSNLALALADRSRFENAILNLCVNARDAMPEGGHLSIEARNTEFEELYGETAMELSPGEYVMVAVSDTGTGMEPETLRRVFEPFYTTKPEGKGSGLGLSTVFGFIKQSNGHVRIYSEPGIGTTVRLYLPRASTMASAEVTTTADARANECGSETILMVEDDDQVCAYVQALLAALGYRVIAARNGQEAIAAFEAHPEIELLMTDIVMPGGMNGFQLAERVKMLRPELPVLFTSGYAENAAVHQGRINDNVHLLSKPYRRHVLASKVRAALESGRSGGAA